MNKKQVKYKQTEIGEIPVHWELTELKNMLTEKGYIRGPFGSTLRRPELKTKGVPVYEQQHAIYNMRDFRYFVDEKKFKELNRFQVKTNDLIISCSGTLGKVSIITEDDPKGIISQALLTLRPNPKKVLPDYLKYFFTSNSGFSSITSRSSGSVQVNIANRQIIEQIKLALPSISEQQLIITILSPLDDKIELKRKMNKTLEETGKTLFKQLFVDDTKQPQQIELQSIVEFNPREALSKGQIATYLEMKDLPEQGMWVYSEVKKPYGGGSKFRNGDTLMARITPCLENGKSGFVNFLDTNELAFGSTEYIVLRPKEKAYEEFVYYLVRDEEFREFAIRSMVGSSGRQRVQTDAIKHYRLSLPSNDIAERFHNVLEPIFGQIKSNAIENEKLSAIRDSLLPRLMSGKLRVN